MITKIIMVGEMGERKIVSLENDMVLIVLSIFGLGFIKLLVDGRISQALINIALIYTGIGPVIHGIYLGLKPVKYIKELIQLGYSFETEEDRSYCSKLFMEQF